MILVIGGTEQGKRNWAMQQFGLAADDIADGTKMLLTPGEAPELAGFKALYGLQALLEQASCWQPDEQAALKAALLALPQDFVVICDEVGLGLVPIDQAGREYRELVGRVCCDMAAKADAVWRVFCGLGQQLK